MPCNDVRIHYQSHATLLLVMLHTTKTVLPSQMLPLSEWLSSGT